jgi:two-component system nitrogen regulation response regulator GlnG/two-component system response regulator HydG
MWNLREAIEFAGPRSAHVLVRGESGTGKELVAAALHRLSGRPGPLVSRNAATFPETLIDAELFGNAEGYPNPGMRERRGLIGAADRGTLFLDEFAELPAAQQARLLRVFDSGEYHRLGDAAARRADLRVVGATNQPNEAFRKDVLSRFDLTVHLPSLRERSEDIPFLLRHLAKAMVADDPLLRARALDAQGEPRFARTMVQELVRNPPAGNVRGLRSALFRIYVERQTVRSTYLPTTAPTRPSRSPRVPRIRRPIAGPGVERGRWFIGEGLASFGPSEPVRFDASDEEARDLRQEIGGRLRWVIREKRAIAALVLLSSAATVRAEPSAQDQGIAEALFREGREAMKGGRSYAGMSQAGRELQARSVARSARRIGDL